MARGRTTTVRQEQEIRRLVTLGITAPKQVYRHMEEMGLLGNGGRVSEKTVARRIRELLPQDDSGPWSPLEEDPDQVSRVGIVFREVFRATGGRVWLTKDFMSWVRTVVNAAPSIRPNWAFAFARTYRDARERGEDTRCLDLALLEEMWELDKFAPGGEMIFNEASGQLDPFERASPNTNSAIIWRGCEVVCGEIGIRHLHQVYDALEDLFPAVVKGGTPEEDRWLSSLRHPDGDAIQARFDPISAKPRQARRADPA